MKNFRRLARIVLAVALALSFMPAALAGNSLRLEDEGTAVKQMQQQLIQLGYLTGSADGKFGPATQAAVTSFQQNNGLTVDGVAGSQTLAKLAALSGSTGSTTTTTTKSTLFGGDYTKIVKGDKGSRVTILQKALNALGYNAGTADGSFGSGTYSAVVWFQGNHGLTTDGKAGQQTLKKLETYFNADGSLINPATPPASNNTANTGSGSGSSGTNTNDGTVPTRTLRRNYTGSDVSSVQTRLKALGYYLGNIDGHYGTGTIAAVVAFQAAHGLSADGNAGAQTFAVLYSPNAKAAGTSGSGSTGSTGSTGNTGSTGSTGTTSGYGTVPTRTLRKGYQGTDVASVQTRLKTLGYYLGTVDGVYGNGTVAAVVAFQAKHGLTADGKAGSQTYAMLYSANALQAGSTTNTAPAVPDSSAAVGTAPTRTLRNGMTGDDVKSVQTRLQTLGYYAGALDGDYGSGTVNAVFLFQSKNGLMADGVAGPATYKILYSTAAVSNSATSGGSTGSAGSTGATGSTGSTGSTVTETYTNLRKGMTSDAVAKLQKALLDLNYEVNTNGTYTNVTVAAVKAFQTRNGLTADGVAGPSTQTLLYSGKALAYENTTTSGPGSVAAGVGVMNNPPSTSQIQLLHWYDDIKSKLLRNGNTIQVYDPASGLTWNLRVGSMGQHADCEPSTLQDTQIMYKAFGNRYTWDEKPVYIKLPGGAWCIASTHDMPHEENWNKSNGFDGHLCVHFPRTMTECEVNAPKNGVRHQNDIRKHWKKITGQDIPW